MDMFCFQCEQTANGTGCTIGGVCGKKADTANLQDELLNNLIALANCNQINDENTELLINGLFITITNVNFDNDCIKNYIEKVKEHITCDFNFDISTIWNAEEDIRSLKSLVLFGLKGMAAYAHHARILGYNDNDVNNFFYEALQKITQNINADELTAMLASVRLLSCEFEEKDGSDGR